MANLYPRVVIGASKSSSGKTTVSLGIMRALCAMGLKVQPYKAGPDYIDAAHHSLAAGRPSRNLDTWMLKEDVVRGLFVRASLGCDISIIEGAMGLFDGYGGTAVGSTAHLARALDAPVVLILDGTNGEQSIAAGLFGFLKYDPKVKIKGVIINKISSEERFRKIKAAVDAKKWGIEVLGFFPKDESLSIKERHLGLMPGCEDRGLISKHEKMGELAAKHINLKALLKIAKGAPYLYSENRLFRGNSSCNGLTAAVAKDAAFNFYYEDNLDMLKDAGFELAYFSPLNDRTVPQEANFLYIGGGFPEVFAKALSENRPMLASIKKYGLNGKPLYAECGGLMYLTKGIRDFNRRKHSMAGLINCEVVMKEKRQALGYVEAQVIKDNILSKKGTRLRGHEFHYSELIPEGKLAYAYKRKRFLIGDKKEDGIISGNILASYLHLHFATDGSILTRLTETIR